MNMQAVSRHSPVGRVWMPNRPDPGSTLTGCSMIPDAVDSGLIDSAIALFIVAILKGPGYLAYRFVGVNGLEVGLSPVGLGGDRYAAIGQGPDLPDPQIELGQGVEY